MPELGPYGSVRGALSNERPYRDLRNVDANYLFERLHRFAGIQPNSGFGDYSRLSCGAGDTQLGAGFCRDLQQALCKTLAIIRRRREGTNWPRSPFDQKIIRFLWPQGTLVPDRRRGGGVGTPCTRPT